VKKNNLISSFPKYLLFICENVQEISALAPIAREIEKCSRGLIQTEFASEDAFYCQGVDDALLREGVKIVSLPYPTHLSKPFHLNSSFKKWKTLFSTNRKIAPVMQHYDGLVCGVDSGPAKMLIASAHKLGKPTFQIVISLYLGEEAERRALKDFLLSKSKYLLKAAAGKLFGADFLVLPNSLASSGCDRIFVMGKRIKEALMRKGIPEGKILNYGIPRFAPLFRLRGESKLSFLRGESFNILYITASCISHGKITQHHLQQNQLHQIVQYFSRDRTKRYKITVKIHPRERKEYYDWLKNYKDTVEVLDGKADLYKAILNSHLVITIFSTVSYEAVLLKRPVILAKFPPSNMLTYEPLDRDFQLAQSLEELVGFIENCNQNTNELVRIIEKEKSNIFEVINPRTPESASLIAKQICNETVKIAKDRNL